MARLTSGLDGILEKGSISPSSGRISCNPLTRNSEEWIPLTQCLWESREAVYGKGHVEKVMSITPNASVQGEKTHPLALLCDAQLQRLYRAARLVPILSLLCLAGPCLHAQQPKPNEYQVKAAYLYNFGRFVNWPVKVTPEPGCSVFSCLRARPRPLWVPSWTPTSGGRSLWTGSRS